MASGACSTLHLWASPGNVGADFVGIPGATGTLAAEKKPQVTGVFTDLKVTAQPGLSVRIDVDRHKRLALTASGALSGLAGALFALFQNFVSPELLFWAMSGEVVIMALLGGLGTLNGGMLGAVIAVGFREVLSSYTVNWLVFLGALYVVSVMFFPQGLMRLRRRRAARDQPAGLMPVDARR